MPREVAFALLLGAANQIMIRFAVSKDPYRPAPATPLARPGYQFDACGGLHFPGLSWQCRSAFCLVLPRSARSAAFIKGLEKQSISTSVGNVRFKGCPPALS